MLEDLLSINQAPAFASGLLQILTGKNEDERFVISGNSESYVVRSRRYKLVHYPGSRDKLFFLLNDQEEKENLIDTYPVIASFLRSKKEAIGHYPPEEKTGQ